MAPWFLLSLYWSACPLHTVMHFGHIHSSSLKDNFDTFLIIFKFFKCKVCFVNFYFLELWEDKSLQNQLEFSDILSDFLIVSRCLFEIAKKRIML